MSIFRYKMGVWIGEEATWPRDICSLPNFKKIKYLNYPPKPQMSWNGDTVDSEEKQTGEKEEGISNYLIIFMISVVFWF